MRILILRVNLILLNVLLCVSFRILICLVFLNLCYFMVWVLLWLPIGSLAFTLLALPHVWFATFADLQSRFWLFLFMVFSRCLLIFWRRTIIHNRQLLLLCLDFSMNRLRFQGCSLIRLEFWIMWICFIIICDLATLVCCYCFCWFLLRLWINCLRWISIWIALWGLCTALVFHFIL